VLILKELNGTKQDEINAWENQDPKTKDPPEMAGHLVRFGVNELDSRFSLG
jgi:hypothetical protein